MADKKIEKMRVGRRANESEGLENNWENLNINKLSVPQGNVVFMFGGNTTNRLDAGNGNAKIIRALVGEKNKGKTTFLSFVYDSEPLRPDGYLSSEYIEETLMLYDKTFKSMLFDENGYIKSKRGIEEAFSKIIFAAHCGGSCFVNIIVNKLYETLTEHYSENTAELLINKIQYYAYAPSETLEREVNSLVVTPYADTSFSFIKALDVAESEKVDIDYPKSVVKNITKARKQGNLRKTFEDAFVNTRAIMFKVGSRTYLIPNQMNPDLSVGDHSIECVARTKFLESGTDYQNNARLAHYASRLFLTEALERGYIDTKKFFNDVSQKIDDDPPEEKGFSTN